MKIWVIILFTVNKFSLCETGLGNAAGAVGRTLQTGAHGISQGPKQLQVITDWLSLPSDTHRLQFE